MGSDSCLVCTLCEAHKIQDSYTKVNLDILEFQVERIQKRERIFCANNERERLGIILGNW